QIDFLFRDLSGRRFSYGVRRGNRHSAAAERASGVQSGLLIATPRLGAVTGEQPLREYAIRALARKRQQLRDRAAPLLHHLVEEERRARLPRDLVHAQQVVLVGVEFRENGDAGFQFGRGEFAVLVRIEQIEEGLVQVFGGRLAAATEEAIHLRLRVVGRRQAERAEVVLEQVIGEFAARQRCNLRGAWHRLPVAHPLRLAALLRVSLPAQQAQQRLKFLR